MKLIVWNSQGGKWDIAWTNYVAPAVTAASPDDVMLFLVESGWGPWVASGDVSINGCYWMVSDVTWFDSKAAGKSLFCQGVEQSRRYKAMWVPWVGNLEALKTNTRCSLGSAFFPVNLSMGQMDRMLIEGFIRPVVRLSVGKGNRSVNVSFTMLIVHMVSGSPGKAKKQLLGLIKKMQQLIPQGSAAIVVGDMNVNLLKTPAFALPSGWSILRTGVATQQSGGELDYGLLYDPSSQFSASTVSVVQQFKSGANISDHSVLEYDIPT